jgi:hypothetical protein
VPTSKTKSPAAKSKQAATNPKLKVKPVSDLEPDGKQAGKVRGGNGGAGGVGSPGNGRGGLVFSDAGLKHEVATIRGAVLLLAKLHRSATPW